MSGALTFGTPYAGYESPTLVGGPYAVEIVGADPMDDGNDATYARGYTKDTVADSGNSQPYIPVDPSAVDGSLLQVTIRCAANVVSSTDPGSLGMRFVAGLFNADPAITDYPTLNFSAGPSSTYVTVPQPHDGTIHDVVVTVLDYMSGTPATATQIEEYFAAGGWLAIQPDAQFGGETIASVTVHGITAAGGSTPTPLTMPANLTQVGGRPGNVTVSWSAVVGATNYEVRTNGGEPVLTGNATRYTVTGLASQADYTIEVRAIGATAGTESPWASVTASTTAPVRPHFRKAVRDGNGTLRLGATIALLEPGTSDPITEPVFSGASSPTVRGSTWVAVNGIVDFYLDDPKVVDIKVTPTGGAAPVTFFNQWVGDVENLHPDGLNATGATSGQTPVADGDGGWAWGSLGGGVTSVNGQSGDVVLTAESLGVIPVTDEVTSLVVLTRAEYDALVTEDPTTVYFIKPGV